MKLTVTSRFTRATLHPGIALALALAGCSGERSTEETQDDAPECEVDDDCTSNEICSDDSTCELGDRDNDFESATPVTQNQPFTGVIQQPGDVDTFAYEASEPEWLRISTEVDETSAPLDTVVAVYDANGALHAWMDDFPTGSVSCCDSLLHVYLPAAGTWYITVQDRTTWFNASDEPGNEGLAYTLNITNSVTTTREPDSLETPSREVEMDSGRSIWTVGVVLEETGDSDWITIQHPYDGTPVQFFGQLDAPGSSIDTRVRLYDTEGTLLLDKKDLGSDGTAVYPNGQKGTYLVEVSDKLGAGDADAWTVLYLRTQEPDSWAWVTEGEPNDGADQLESPTFETRTTSSGTPYEAAYIQGDLNTTDDEDWFELTTVDAHYLSVQCFGGDQGALGDVEGEILNESGDVLHVLDDAADSTSPWLINTGPYSGETLHLRLFTTSDASGPAVFYRCNLFVTPFEVSE